jgi:hypothetical protein
MKKKPVQSKTPKIQAAPAPAAAGEADGMTWFSLWDKPFRVLGMGWPIPDGGLRRMPVKPQWTLPEGVEGQAWHTAGVQVRFRTTARRIALRVKLRGTHSMDHITATGQCGFDAYIGEVGAMTFAGVSRFSRGADAYQVTLCNFPSAELRTVTINCPLYMGVAEVAIGLPTGCRLAAAPRPALKRPVVIYGTSITQGGCASRPGMAYTNILSRRIDCEFLNLGFSGSGRGEPEVAHTIATLPPPALFVMDYEANCHVLEKMQETLPVFLGILRKRWPRTEILVVSKIPYAAEAYDAVARQRRLANRDFQRKTVARLRRAGDTHITFLDGSGLLGKDYTECSVDGAHQTDLGFLRMANGMEKTLRKLLN